MLHARDVVRFSPEVFIQPISMGLKHVFRVLHNNLRERAKHGSVIAQKLMGESPRSDKWPKIEKEYLAKQPKCQACNGTQRLNVHHKQPFHIHPELELDLNNLITLCMGATECHIRIGHGDDFKMYNPNVVTDAAEILAHPEKRAEIEVKAKATRLVN